MDFSYDVSGIAAQVDFINLMSYDLHGAWDHQTGHNAPLYDRNSDLNVDSCVRYWLAKGCPKEKLVVGIPTYGRSFTLQTASNNGLSALTVGPGHEGITAEKGTLGYNEIVNNNWQRQWIESQKVPYAYNGNQWVGYDDVRSVTEKSNYIVNKGLGGCMFWSIETDDFKRGYPLISAASNIIT